MRNAYKVLVSNTEVNSRKTKMQMGE